MEQTRGLKAATGIESIESFESMASSISLEPVARFDSNLSNVTKHLDEATRQILRSRLIMATLVTLFFLLAIKILSFTLDGFTLVDLLTRMTALLVLAATLFYLVKHPNVTLLQLRVVEIVIFTIPVAEALLVLVQEVQKRVAIDTLDEVPALFAMISFAIAIFIAIYGMYIPANWKRTLIVVGIAAILPSIVAMIHQALIDSAIENYPGFVAPLMTLTMAAVATKAAHVVQTVRREAAEAKYYGQYELVKEIGEGGMGKVYQAKHRMLKRPAAIKLIRTEIADNPETVAEFENEVQLSASLTHWNTVQVYDYGRTDDGEFYYVMEHLEGLTLEQKIRRGKLSITEMVHIVCQICDGLAEAHGKGMIHRDIKPANVFLTQVGHQKNVIKILDFGLAVMKCEVSRLKKISGTPAYMSPEQIDAGAVDNRSDIYSLGLVIYECLAGKRLMIADSIGELLRDHRNKKPSLDQLPESASEFADIIYKCIEKNPQDRFENVTVLKNALLGSDAKKPA